MKFHKKNLKNGLRVITVPMQENETVTVMVLVGAGSFHESKATNGIAHFLEHMCFKGTERRPSAYQISFDFEKIGASYNAFTSNEYTGYYAKAHHRHLADVLELVSDMYLHPLLPESEIEKEKGVIIEEINRKYDHPGNLLWKELDKTVYGDQPAGRDVLGPKENIKHFSKKDIVEYRKKYYVAANTTVVVAGKFSEKSILLDLEKRFEGLSKKSAPKRPKTKEAQTEPQAAVVFKKTDQTNLALLYRTFDRYDERGWALGLCATILGRGMSSRLFQKIREEKGLCYSIAASSTAATDHGAFVISSGVGNKKVEEATRAILEEIEVMKKELVSDKELQKAKDQRVGWMYLGLESSDDFSDFYGFQELFKDKILTPQEKEKKIQAVTAEEVRAMARQFLIPKNLTLGIVGPHTSATKMRLKKLLKKS
ncbi:MAG: pitrilysin family protein [Candidatus Pacebacteria bacterium]|nr:pitrilysin family protein [Candidatus Paceibacterota bacterium]